MGILLLLFVAYQLWGTGIYEARAQDHLRSQFERSVQKAKGSTHNSPPSTTAPASTTTTTTTLPPQTVPPNGDAVARILIPKIGLDKIVVEGVDVDDLRKGPGHYPETQLPGHEGNSAIAGHRTTYGAPFGDLDQLGTGDEVTLIATNGGVYRYKVTEQRVVDPSEVSVLDPTPDPANAGHELATLTLTTCNPKYSAAERLVVKGQLELPKGQTLPLSSAATPKGTGATTISGLSGERSSRTPAILWGAVTAVVGLLWWLWFHRYARWTTWIAGAVPFLVALFVCYTFLERLLPSNY